MSNTRNPSVRPKNSGSKYPKNKMHILQHCDVIIAWHTILCADATPSNCLPVSRIWAGLSGICVFFFSSAGSSSSLVSSKVKIFCKYWPNLLLFVCFSVLCQFSSLFFSLYPSIPVTFYLASKNNYPQICQLCRWRHPLFRQLLRHRRPRCVSQQEASWRHRQAVWRMSSVLTSGNTKLKQDLEN